VPSSEQSESWQFNLWIDWMREVVQERNLPVESALIEKARSEYKG